ncbi:hypothetical protein [Streptomyces sp. NPDC017991]|uniref:hypothetical protein n=1 Tax=Streptomyces sp. NPDC017991 TaxID=3365026 RepID=UPI0037A2C968
MWRLPDAIAQRFPLVARPRPACLPLPQRVHKLTELADSAAKLDDASVASTVYNQAALTASDVGALDVAREMCHQHAAAYLHATPLPARAAIRALEPVVNLARLQLSAGQSDKGRQSLLALFDAVTTGSAIRVEGIAVPSDLVANAADRQELRARLWSVILADGTRALTAAGRWAEALAHVEAHHGVGHRMLDGRQVAVLAALTAGNSQAADQLIATTTPGETWERSVTDVLAALCHRVSGRPGRGSLRDLANTYLERSHQEDLTVFDTRLGLAVLDVIDSADAPAARTVVAELHRRTMRTTNGHAARETINHPLFAALATNRQTKDCRALVQACALGNGMFPEEVGRRLSAAVRISDRVIRQSVDHPKQAASLRTAVGATRHARVPAAPPDAQDL